VENADATSLTLLRLLCQPERDEDAWSDFCSRYQPLIRRWCRRFHLQDADADDVSQKVLLRLAERIHTYDPERGERFRGWLKTVVENAVKDLLRQGERRPGDRGTGDSDVLGLLQAIAEPGTIDTLVSELDTSLRRDLADIQARVKKNTKPDNWRCFELVVLEGWDLKDAAAHLGKTYMGVVMAVKRIKKRLRALGAELGRERQAAGEDQP
jgi:RNA polymerase sigma-70 factor (ECF subfamily)